MKVIIIKNFDSKSIKSFVDRIQIIDKTFENSSIIKYEIPPDSDNYLFITRPKYDTSLDSLDEIVIDMKIRGADKLISTICGVLKEFHKMNFYHGGIKLSNIFIKEEGYMICDHCYKMLYSNNPTITNDNINTLSPEELRCKEIGLEIDMWSLGILIYKVYNGRYPFEEKNIIQTANKIIKEDFKKLSEEFNEKLNIILCGLLKKVPKERYTIKEVEEEINKMDSQAHMRVENNNDLCIFTENNKHKFIEISKNGEMITNKKSDGKFHHCFHNIKMESGIYHLEYRVHGMYNFMFGATTKKDFKGKELGNRDDRTTCSIGIHVNNSNLYGSNGRKFTLKKLPIKTVDNGFYEVIYNINKKTMKMVYNGDTYLLYTNILHTPLYPFVSISSMKYKVELIKYWIEDDTEEDEETNNNYYYEEEEEEEEKEDDDIINEFNEEKNDNGECCFSSKNKYKDIIIKNDNKLIVNKKFNYINHYCFLSIKMVKNVHHFVFVVYGGCYGFVFGTTNENKNIDSISNDENTCAINFSYDKMLLEGKNGKKKLSKENESKIKLQNKCECEFIYDLDNRTISIKKQNECLRLFEGFSIPLVPFVGIMHINCSIELINYWEEANGKIIKEKKEMKKEEKKEVKKEEKKEVKKEIKKEIKKEEFNCCFIKDDKKPFELKNNNKKMIKTDDGFAPCYLNIKLENGIHHFLFKIDGDDEICIGGTKNNKIEDTSIICDDDGTCCFTITSSFMHLCGGNGKKMIEEEFKDIKGVRNDVYEIIFNINDSTMNIKYKERIVLLWKDIEFPLYPFVIVFEKDNSIELIKYFKE